MTATKIQPGDDLHLTSLMAPHSLNFVTGADRAALLAYGRDVFAAARDSKCLAQIEEPAQPVLYVSPGQLANHSNPEGPESEKAGRYLPARVTPGGKFTQPLYAGAAPADGAPRARDLLGIVRTAQAEARRLINGEDSGSDLAQTKLDLPETLRVLEHALSQPAAVAGVAWDKTRDSLATLLLGLARRPFLDFDVAGIALDAATEPGMPLAYMRVTPAAPALEAPAAPAGNEEVAFTKWFQCQQGTPYQGMWEFARAAWMARAAAPALDAPAAPATSAQVQALHRARRALHAIGKTYDDSELRTRALEADEEIDRMLAAAPQTPAQEAPAAPAVPTGFALVPIEPTQEMLNAGRRSGADSVSIQEEWARKEMWSRMLATITPPPAAYTDDLVALVENLAQALSAAAPDNDLAGHALNYLKRNGLQGSPLRAAEAAPQAPAAPSVNKREEKLAPPMSPSEYLDHLLAAPTAPSALATQVIENLLQLARIVNTAVEDWGESFPDGSCEVKFHKDEADKMEAILEFFDSLPDAPEEEGVILSGPSRAARVLRAQAAPAAPAVDAEPLFAPGTVIGDVVRDTELIVQNDARYRLLRRGQHWSVIDGKGDVLRGDELDSTIDARLAAQAAAKGEHGNG